MGNGFTMRKDTPINIGQMNKRKLKVGDYVFHNSADGGSLGCEVLRIGRGDRIQLSAYEGHSMWVNASKCQLQEEWAEEHETTIAK